MGLEKITDDGIIPFEVVAGPLITLDKDNVTISEIDFLDGSPSNSWYLGLVVILVSYSLMISRKLVKNY